MPNNVAHFAVHADDVDRARRFYGKVFGWSFERWGPPGFFLVRTGSEEEPGIMGAVQEREEPLTGTGMRGYECTISVDSVDAIASAIEEHGGEVLLPRTAISGVGWLVRFEDTEGNVAAAMQYDERAG